MSKVNCLRKGCKDVFNAFLVENAVYDGILEIPVLKGGIYHPDGVIEFSKALSSQEYDYWVHFYEDDSSFERIWKNPKKYLPILKRYAGVIAPDFSLYRDMPLVMQLWNIYRNHAIGSWLQENGVNVIPNVRFGDERTYDACCLGVPHNSTIAIGTHGCVKNRIDREYLSAGIDHVISTLKPRVLVIYGTTPADIFDKYRDQGISILQFNSSFANSRAGDQNGNR